MWLKQSIIKQINILKTNAPTYGLYEDVSVHVCYHVINNATSVNIPAHI